MSLFFSGIYLWSFTFPPAELTGNFENHQADVDVSVHENRPKQFFNDRMNRFFLGWCHGIFPILTKGSDIFVSYTFNTQWFLCFFHCSSCIWKKKHQNIHMFFTFKVDFSNQISWQSMEKNKPLDVYLLQQLPWSGGKRFSMHGICCWHWWGFPARLPNGDESRTKNSKFGKNNKKSGALVEVFQHILETKNSINSQSKTSLFTSQMRPFITKPWRQQNRRHRGCKI